MSSSTESYVTIDLILACVSGRKLENPDFWVTSNQNFTILIFFKYTRLISGTCFDLFSISWCILKQNLVLFLKNKVKLRIFHRLKHGIHGTTTSRFQIRHFTLSSNKMTLNDLSVLEQPCLGRVWSCLQKQYNI